MTPLHVNGITSTGRLWGPSPSSIYDIPYPCNLTVEVLWPSQRSTHLASPLKTR